MSAAVGQDGHLPKTKKQATPTTGSGPWCQVAVMRGTSELAHSARAAGSADTTFDPPLILIILLKVGDHRFRRQQ